MRLGDLDALYFSQRYALADPDSNKMIPVLAVDKAQIDAMPTIDAVPVVRCKDCKHQNSPYCPMCYGEYYYDEDDGGDFYVIDKAVDPNGFCSYGEKEDGDG